MKLEALTGFEPACDGLQPPTSPLGHRTLVKLVGATVTGVIKPS